MKICIFAGEGRLGNQIIQLAALRKIYPDLLIYSIGSDSFGSMFESPNVRCMKKSKFLEKLIRKIVFPVFLRPLSSWTGFFGYCTEKRIEVRGRFDSSGDPEIKSGWIPCVIAERLFFQNFQTLLNRKDFQWIAEAYRDFEVPRYDVGKVVLHVRRGDYMGFNTYGLSNVVLTREYYIDAVEAIRSKFSDAGEVIVITDDPTWARQELGVLGTIEIRSASEAEDFATLVSAKYLVCSNSTFSLAASLISASLIYCIAPEFWFGKSIKEWFPRYIKLCDDRYVYI